MQKANCAACVYSLATKVEPPPGTSGEIKELLICRRYPPQVWAVVTMQPNPNVFLQAKQPMVPALQVNGTQPVVTDQHWCGEFE